jgi:predicted secreted protein
LSTAESGEEFDVAIGQIVVLRLDANHSTGYGWTRSDSGVPIVKMVGNPFYIGAAAPAPGTNGTEIWLFVVGRKGQRKLELQYRRQWERDVAPTATVNYTVRSGSDDVLERR